ncbi:MULTISPECIES: HIRAN domain-containing protein [unclassified Novosphingobium]|uniref:HIRAN domain-containing protein n=1 Tax=unclassified Novosphingobium TaxID=2644732 RepID=UPI0013583657|nr:MULTISPECIES: HIRAN domain-containing protein [unclassified Novosphingobium]
MGWNDFSLPAVGERHDNDDGTSRQEELAHCQPGEEVRLVREPENEHDRMAVAVISCRGIKVGYLKRDRAVWIGSKIDRGYDVRAIVERVKGAHLEGAALGLVMRVNMEGDDPELISPSVRIPNRVAERAKIKSMVSDMVLCRASDIL